VFVFDRGDADWLKTGGGTTWYSKNAEKVEIADGDSITTDLKLPVWDNR
jgi:hypothetical protein